MSAYNNAIIGASAFNPANFGKVVFSPESNYYNGQTNSQILNNAYTQSALAYDMYMSNTSYQRAVDDLRSAGLNPYLVMSGGNGASGGSMSAFARATGQNSLSPFQKDLEKVNLENAQLSRDITKLSLSNAKMDNFLKKVSMPINTIKSAFGLSGSSDKVVNTAVNSALISKALK